MKRIYDFLRFWPAATRAAFSSASLIPVLLGSAIAAHDGYFNPWILMLSAVGVLSLHLGANLVNDYYDFTSGADVARDSRTPFYGGGTILVQGILTPQQVRQAYRLLFLTAFIVGLVLAMARGIGVLAFGLAGFLGGYFYTAPPLQLSYKELGEATIGLCFGPLTIAGAYLAQTGTITIETIVASIPVGLLVAAIVLVNEFPDRGADCAAGKRTLAVGLPLHMAFLLYAALVLMPFPIIGAAILFKILPHTGIATFIALPLAIYALRQLRLTYFGPATQRICALSDDHHDTQSAREDACVIGQDAPALCHQNPQVAFRRGISPDSRQVAASIATILLHFTVGVLLSISHTWRI
ncbi:MAG: prenyltransferase [Firmicutes bacterium]|nr:prenyltransferase [Bacillota bacterium]